MRMTYRLVAAVLVIGLLAAAPGCKRPAGSGKGVPSSTQPGAYSSKGDRPELNAARQAGETFLTWLREGKAPAGRLTVDLRKRVSGTLVFQVDKELGYSDSDADNWLKKQGEGVKSATSETLVLSPAGDRASLRGTLTSASGTETFAMRLVSDGGNWLIDRWHRGPAVRTAMPKEEPTAELLWAREGALDFLDSLLAGDRKAAAACLAPALKAKVAKPVFSDDEKLGYSPTHLDKWLTAAAEGMKNYAITSQQLAAGGSSADFAGELTDGKKTAPFKLQAAPEKGAWLVSEFGLQPGK